MWLDAAGERSRRRQIDEQRKQVQQEARLDMLRRDKITHHAFDLARPSDPRIIDLHPYESFRDLEED
jgi:hypothetical protein